MRAYTTISTLNSVKSALRFKRLGQVFRYRPEKKTLELFYEGTDANDMESPHNIIVTPFGDL